MKSTNVPHGEILAAQQRLWGAVGDQADEVVDNINTNPEIVHRISRFMVRCCYEPTSPQKLARSIMGSNFFGVGDAVEYLGVNPTRDQLARLVEIRTSRGLLITKEEMIECKDTHILVADFGLSILDIFSSAQNRTNCISFQFGRGCAEVAFSRKKGEIGWRLVLKGPVVGSTSRTWSSQQTLLPKSDETPTARIMVYSMVGHFLASGEHSTREMYLRTADVHPSGERIYVSCFEGKTLIIAGRADGAEVDVLGLASMRKP